MQDLIIPDIHKGIDERSQLQAVNSTLPAHWKLAKLGDIARVHYGKARPNDTGAFPVIGSGGTYGSTTKPLIEYKTLIIGRKGAAGSVYYASKPCYPSDTAFYLEWNQEVCVEFLYNLLQFHGFAPDKSIIPSLQRSDVENFNIIFPPLPEQRAIAHILQTIQNAIQARCKEIELERERKAALMQHLFTHGTRNEPTKMSEIGEIPESWEVVKLDGIATIRYGLGQPPEKDNDGIPMIRATDIKQGLIVKDTVIRVKREAIPENRASFLKKGDIIVVRSGAYTGDVALYDGEWDTAIAGYDLVVSLQDKEISPNFIAYYLLGNAIQSYFRSQRDRSAQPHLNADQLSNARILRPSGGEQKEIASILQACDSKIAALEKELALHEELFRALLDELMSGRLSALPVVEVENGYDAGGR